MTEDERWMSLALEEAAAAGREGEVPVGAVLVRDGACLSRGRNRTIGRCDPSAHAEVEAVRAAAQVVGNYRLTGCTLYATLEPCAMCAGLAAQARLDRLVYGAPDPRWGCLGSRLDLGAPGLFNHTFSVTGGVGAEPSRALLQNFFQARRKSLKAGSPPPREAPPYPVYSRTFPERGGRGAHVVLHPNRPRWVVVNDAGLAFAEALGRGERPEEAARRFAERCGVPSERVQADLDEFTRQWEAKGMGRDIGRADPHETVDVVEIHLTERCNLRCTHCYAGCPSSSAPRELSGETVRALLADAARLGAASVVLTGGEPLLHPEFPGLLRQAAEQGTVQVLTNGCLVDAAAATLLTEAGAEVQISLDGPEAEIHDAIRGPGAFAAALAGIDRLREAGAGDRLTLAFTLMDANLDQAAAMVDFACALGLPRLRFLPLRRVGDAAKHWSCTGGPLSASRLEDTVKTLTTLAKERRGQIALSCGLSGVVLLPETESPDGLWCSLGAQLSIRADGAVYPCSLLSEPRFELGNIHHAALFSIAAAPQRVEIRRRMACRPDAVETCRACPWKRLCQGGCVGLALHDAGAFEAVDRFCALRKRFYCQAFDRLLERFATGG